MADLPLLAPGRQYRLTGPEGEWVMLGLDTSGETATVHLVTAAEYERRTAWRAGGCWWESAAHLWEADHG